MSGLQIDLNSFGFEMGERKKKTSKAPETKHARHLFKDGNQIIHVHVQCGKLEFCVELLIALHMQSISLHRCLP